MNPITPNALNGTSSAAISRFFSTRILRDMSLENGGKLFRHLALELDLIDKLPRSATIEHFYERAIETLIRKDRSEYVYKNAIAQKLLLGRHSVNTTSLFFEFRSGQSKLDALFLNGSSHAYEIKTSQDELRRLPSQLADYQKQFEYVWVLTSNKHVAGVREMAPREVGIAILSKRYQISIVRKASKRVKHLELDAMFSSMRRNEFLEALNDKGIEVPRTPNTLIHAEAARLAQNIKPTAFHDAMVKQLKKRFAKKQAQIAKMLPRPLTAAGLGLNINNAQAARLVAKLQTRLGDL